MLDAGDTNVGHRFVAYIGAPGPRSQVANPTGELTDSASPRSGLANHLYVYAGGNATSLTVKYLDTDGSIPSETFSIFAAGYCDRVADASQYTAMDRGENRPYISIDADKPVTLVNDN